MKLSGRGQRSIARAQIAVVGSWRWFPGRVKRPRRGQRSIAPAAIAFMCSGESFPQRMTYVGAREGSMGASAERIVLFFFQAEDGIRDSSVTGVQTCALPI